MTLIQLDLTSDSDFYNFAHKFTPSFGIDSISFLSWKRVFKLWQIKLLYFGWKKSKPNELTQLVFQVKNEFLNCIE